MTTTAGISKQRLENFLAAKSLTEDDYYDLFWLFFQWMKPEDIYRALCYATYYDGRLFGNDYDYDKLNADIRDTPDDNLEKA